MELASEITRLFPQLTVSKNKGLSEYTTFKLGGPCPLLIEGARTDLLPDLMKLLYQNNTPALVIGQGSNLIVSDHGLDQAVIRFCSHSPDISANGSLITVSGDTLLDDLARFTTENETGDLSFCSGIPGTVGGAITGNAGAFGQQIGDHLVSAVLLDPSGATRTVPQDDFEFAYRHSKIKESGEILLSATFDPPEESGEIMRTERERILQFRREHHPDWHQTPCAGSVFRNIEPTSAVERRKAAGWFLEEAGAQMLHAGGAHIFEKHANMVIAGPGCTAQNVYELTEKMIAAVQKKFGFTLVREVRFLGNFD